MEPARGPMQRGDMSLLLQIRSTLCHLGTKVEPAARGCPYLLMEVGCAASGLRSSSQRWSQGQEVLTPGHCLLPVLPAAKPKPLCTSVVVNS